MTRKVQKKKKKNALRKHKRCLLLKSWFVYIAKPAYMDAAILLG